MDKFFSQLDQFLAALPMGSVGNLAEVFYGQEVITLDERREVEEGMAAEDSSGADAKTTLMSILRTTRDPAKLRAISQSLQAFKLLYKDTKTTGHTEQEKKEHHPWPTTTTVTSKGSVSNSAIEEALLKKFEDGIATHAELSASLQKASSQLDVRTIKNFEGKTLLHLSCCYLTLDTVKHLVERYKLLKYISLCDNDGNTPLHDACRCKKTQIVKYLISLPNCSPNAQNFDGDTPLHVAVMHSHWSVGRELLTSRDVQVSMENEEGYTPLNLLELQLSSPDTKKMMKEMRNHVSMKGATKQKRAGSNKDKKNPTPLAAAKKNVQFGDDIGGVKKQTPKVAIDAAKAHPAAVSIPILSHQPASLNIPPSPRTTSSSPMPASKRGVKFPAPGTKNDEKENKHLDVCKACLTGNPPVICVLLLMFVGVALACAIIATAGAILLK